MKLSAPTPLATATPTAETVGVAGAVGTSPTAARADHVHALLGSSPQATQLLGATAAAGVSGAPSRFDHVHGFSVVDAVLAADLPLTTTTLAAVTGLTITLGAGETWAFCYRLGFSDAAADGVKTDIDGPAGVAALMALTSIVNPSAGVRVDGVSVAYNNVIQGALNLSDNLVDVRGTVKNGATPGTFALRVAERAAVGTITLLKGSSLWAWRVS